VYIKSFVLTPGDPHEVAPVMADRCHIINHTAIIFFADQKNLHLLMHLGQLHYQSRTTKSAALHLVSTQIALHCDLLGSLGNSWLLLAVFLLHRVLALI
jgi:hypothetical protein